MLSVEAQGDGGAGISWLEATDWVSSPLQSPQMAPSHLSGGPTHHPGPEALKEGVPGNGSGEPGDPTLTHPSGGSSPDSFPSGYLVMLSVRAGFPI